MVSGINKVVRGVGVLCLLTFGALGAPDPVRDYLSTLSVLGGDNNFYADDRLLRLDADIDGDGVNEVFITLGRNRNGKQGNAWSIYSVEKDRAEHIGGATFNDGGIYVGRVEEIHAYGIVSYWSAGGGEGQIMVTTLKNGHMSERSLGAVERNRETGVTKGRELLDKYFNRDANAPRQMAQEITAEELKEKYGLKVESETYSEYLTRESKAIDARLAAEAIERAAAKALPKMDESLIVDAKAASTGAVLPSAAAPVDAAPAAAPAPTAAPVKATADATVDATVDATRRRNILISLALIVVLTTGHLFYRARRP